jgi:hypothetical protein
MSQSSNFHEGPRIEQVRDVLAHRHDIGAGSACALTVGGEGARQIQALSQLLMGLRHARGWRGNPRTRSDSMLR